MPLSSLYTLPRAILSNQRKERKVFLQAHNWELDRFLLAKRFWWRYLLWPCHFISRTCGGLAVLFAMDCAGAYCVIADRLLGGSRYERFEAVVDQKIAARNEKYRQARKRFEAGLIKSTQRRLYLESLKEGKESKTVH